MKSKLAMTMFAAASLLLACPASNASRAGAAPEGAISVRFEFAHTPVTMDLGGFTSLPEAMRMVAELTFEESVAPDGIQDVYVFRDGKTAEKLLTTNLRGLRALMGGKAR
jgi:hypothetical protein